jgi:hypothetical protein
MTLAEKNQWQSMTAELIMAESRLSGAQSMLTNAQRERDDAQKRLGDFMAAIPISDAPAAPKRGRPVGSRTTRNAANPAQELLDSANNAAVQG